MKHIRFSIGGMLLNPFYCKKHNIQSFAVYCALKKKKLLFMSIYFLLKFNNCLFAMTYFLRFSLLILSYAMI
uniref:Putative ovule protein n=1 Tax=Solanum chacoense TaxID=4108 RepID=A0A0V0H4E8_SOLCH